MDRKILNYDGLWGLLTGYRVSRVVFAAHEFGVFDRLAKGRADLPTLCKDLGIHARPAGDFFAALANLGLIVKEGDHYSNAPVAARYLLRASSESIGGLLRMYDRIAYHHWEEIPKLLRTGKPQIPDEGNPFGELFATSEGQEEFFGGMFAISYPQAKMLAEAHNFGTARILLDVGGGTGAWPIAFCRRYPKLQAILFDLPEIEPIAKETIREQGMARRITFRGGDFFKDPLPRADLVVLSQILHDWSLADRIQILRKVHEVLVPGGNLIVSEFFLRDDRTGPRVSLLSSLNMMLATPGNEFTGRECQGWLEEAGFGRARSIPLLSGNIAMLAPKTTEKGS